MTLPFKVINPKACSIERVNAKFKQVVTIQSCYREVAFSGESEEFTSGMNDLKLDVVDTINHSSHNNISAIPTTMNRNIAVSSARTVKHWKWCTWHQKVSDKNSSELNKFLHSEVNLLIQHIKMELNQLGICISQDAL